MGARAKYAGRAAVALAVLLLGAAPVLWAGVRLAQAVGEKGSINWCQGRVEGVGVGTPMEKYQSRPQARAIATDMAHEEAFKNLLAVVGAVRVDCRTTVGDLAGDSQVIEAQVREMVRKAELLKREHLSDGTVKERLALPLFGGLAQLVLPREIVQVPQGCKVRASPGAAPAGGPHTGLVVDALSLSACPALSPRILDPDGREVFGPACAGRDYASAMGLFGYETSLADGRKNPRAGKNPLVVRALSVKGPGQCDFVVSAADAARIRGSSENIEFLRKCRVVAVVDQACADCPGSPGAP